MAVGLFWAVLLVAATFWYFYRKQKQQYLTKFGIKCPPSNWFWGNFDQLTESNVNFYTECKAKFGKIFGFYIGTRPQIAINDVELLSIIQVKEFDSFHRRAFIQVEGDIFCDPTYEVSIIDEPVSLQRWKQQRSILTPSFSSAKLKASVPLINDSLATMFKLIEERRTENADVDLYLHFQGLTLDTIGRSAFGVETNAQENPNDRFFVAIKNMFNSLASFPGAMVFLLSLLCPEFEASLYWIRRAQMLLYRALGWSQFHYVINVTLNIIKERMSNPQLARNDLLQNMIEAISPLQPSSKENESKLTIEEAAANSFVLFEAGFETTSTLLGYMGHIMITYPEEQEKLRDEVRELYDRDGEIGYNVLKLPYMDAVMNECLRLYPPITDFVNRHAGKEIKYKDITIPKGAIVTVPLYQLHRDPDYWPQPEKFDPERWMGERKKQIVPLAFQPFGTGPRLCIGMRFALLEAKMAIAKLLLKYKVQPCAKSQVGDELQFEYKPISMVPKKGIFVKLTLLEHESK